MWQKDGYVTALHDFQIHKNIQRELGKPYCTSAQVTEAGAKNDAKNDCHFQMLVVNPLPV